MGTRRESHGQQDHSVSRSLKPTSREPRVVFPLPSSYASVNPKRLCAGDTRTFELVMSCWVDVRARAGGGRRIVIRNPDEATRVA